MRHLSAQLCLAALLLASGRLAVAGEGRLFSDFSCANVSPARVDRPDLWRQLGLGMARCEATWPAVQPRPDEWQWADVDVRLLELANAGIPALLLIGYTPPWAWVDEGYTFEEAGHRWEVTLGAFDPSKGHRPAHLRLTHLTDGKVTEGEPGNLPPKSVADWERFVEHVVRRYSRPPFNVRYFQVWNEFNWPVPWYMQTWRDFIDRIHVPAARIIRRHGGQVVFGGWACTAGPDDLCNLLEYHDAWKHTDIIDFHYQVNAAFQVCYDRYVRGGKCRGIWQTEVGWTEWKEYLVNVYPRVFYWALKHGYDNPDKYKMFWFHYVGPSALALTDQFAPGQPLGEHGKCLRTLANLLVGRVRAWDGYTTRPGLPFSLTEESPSSEGFATANGVVVAAHLPEAELANTTPLGFGLPGLAPRVVEVRACDRLGADLPVEVERRGRDLAVTVGLRAASPETWRFEARGLTVFLRVILDAAPPA